MKTFKLEISNKVDRVCDTSCGPNCSDKPSWVYSFLGKVTSSETPHIEIDAESEDDLMLKIDMNDFVSAPTEK